MKFLEIGETTTIEFDMNGLHALALICKTAVECGDGIALEAEALREAFTAAALIARTHGDMTPGMREHLAQIHARIQAGER